MAFWEITIFGTISCRDEDDDITVFDEQSFVFIREAPDLIAAMMMVQPQIDAMNEIFRNKPRKAFLNEHDEFKIIGIIETNLIDFSDEWINNYVNLGIVQL